MAGDWIKMRCCLPDEPEVVGMAHSLNVTPEHICGSLLRVWGLGDSHAMSRFCPDGTGTKEGLLSRYCPADIDKKAGLNGFAEAMLVAGWLSVYADGVAFPEWDEHHSKSAKIRASEQKKKRRQRSLSPSLSQNCPDGTGTKEGTREEKSKNKTPLPPFSTPEFARAWADWEQHRREKKKPLTPTSLKKQFGELAAMGEARAIAALDHSIKNGWTGIFEPEAKQQSQRPQLPAPKMKTLEDVERERAEY